MKKIMLEQSKIKNIDYSFKDDNRLPFLMELKRSYLEYNVGNFNDRKERIDSLHNFLLDGSSVFNTIDLANDYKDLISLGDTLRFSSKGDISLYSELLSNDKVLPMLVGLNKDKEPNVIDFAKETGLTIVGGSGVGKSWWLSQMLLQQMLYHTKDELNIILVDYVNSMMYKELTRFPHVIGHIVPKQEENSSQNFFKEIIKVTDELITEIKRRQDYLNKNIHCESIEESHRLFRNENQLEKLKEIPYLYFIIEDMTSIMYQLKKYDLDLYEKLRNNLEKITQESRRVGIKFISANQRSIENSVPFYVMANTSLKLGFRMGTDSDYEKLFPYQKDLNDMEKPNRVGKMLVGNFTKDVLELLYSVTVGGNSHEDTLNMLKTISSIYLNQTNLTELSEKPIGTDFKHAFNRDIRAKEYYNEIKEGYSIDRRYTLDNIK